MGSGSGAKGPSGLSETATPIWKIPGLSYSSDSRCQDGTHLPGS